MVMINNLIRQLSVHSIISEHFNDNIIDLAFIYEVDHNDVIQALDENNINYTSFKASNSIQWHIFTDNLGFEFINNYLS